MTTDKARNKCCEIIAEFLKPKTQQPRDYLMVLAAGIVRALEADGIILSIKKRKRTLKQNAFLHLLFDYLGEKMGMSPEIVKEGIKATYGYRVGNPFAPGERMIKPTSEYATDEITVLIEGCFAEAAEQRIDMTEFIEQWEKIKKAALRKAKNESFRR